MAWIYLLVIDILMELIKEARNLSEHLNLTSSWDWVSTPSLWAWVVPSADQQLSSVARYRWAWPLRENCHTPQFFHILISISSVSFVDEFGSSQLSTELNSLNSSGMPTPSSGTRPGSQTNSYSGQLSVASGMSVVDDRKLDEILGDGLQNQVSLSKIKVKILIMDLMLNLPF